VVGSLGEKTKSYKLSPAIATFLTSSAQALHLLSTGFERVYFWKIWFVTICFLNGVLRAGASNLGVRSVQAELEPDI
jgi:hypothetical protein